MAEDVEGQTEEERDCMTIEEADDLAKAMFGPFAYVEVNEQEADPGKRFFIKMGIAGKSFEECFEKAMDTTTTSTTSTTSTTTTSTTSTDTATNTATGTPTNTAMDTMEVSDAIKKNVRVG